MKSKKRKTNMGNNEGEHIDEGEGRHGLGNYYYWIFTSIIIYNITLRKFYCFRSVRLKKDVQHYDIIIINIIIIIIYYYFYYYYCGIIIIIIIINVVVVVIIMDVTIPDTSFLWGI